MLLTDHVISLGWLQEFQIQMDKILLSTCTLCSSSHFCLCLPSVTLSLNYVLTFFIMKNFKHTQRLYWTPICPSPRWPKWPSLSKMKSLFCRVLGRHGRGLTSALEACSWHVQACSGVFTGVTPLLIGSLSKYDTVTDWLSEMCFLRRVVIG